MKSTVKFIAAFAIIGLVTGTAGAAISITNLTQGYTQNFDTAPIPVGTRDAWTWTDDSTFEGWYRRANVNNGTQTPDPDLLDYTSKGAGVTIDGFYNAHNGTNPDAAVGFLVDGNSGGLKKGSVGIIFTNETGSTIGSFDVSYRGEQWYRSTFDTTLKFQWIVTNSFADINSDIDRAGAPWNDSGALDWYAPTNATAGWLNGQLLANGTNLSTTVNNNVNLAPGQVLILRWRIPESGSQENGLFIDDVVVTNFTAVPPDAGNSAVVFFGGDAGIFTGDVETNNLFVAQTDAGEIVQWNGVNSAGGSFGASGTLVNQGVGGALTNSANNLILTTVGIAPGGSSTFATGLPNVLGITGGAANAQFNASAGEAWTFEFNKPVQLKQLVLTALDFNAETIKVTVAGVDTNSFTRLDANMAGLVWEGSPANKYIYTYSSPVVVPAGTDITIEANPGNWGLQGVVVDATAVFAPGSLTLIDFGGPNNKFNDPAYQADLGEGYGVDEILAWFGDDIWGRFGEFGDLNDEGVGAAMTSLTYNVSIKTLAISSLNAASTNTTQNGGKLGVDAAGGAGYFHAADADSWTFEWDQDVVLFKVGFKGLTGGAEEAEIIIGGVTNTITPADTVDATHEVAQLYTFPAPVNIPAFTDVQVNCPAGIWGIRQFLVGVTNAPVYPQTYDEWAAQYGLAAGSETNNNDGDIYSNLFEFAQGGNPTNENDVGFLPEIYTDGGTVTYVYYKKKDADTQNLVYTVDVNTNLLTDTWTSLTAAGFTQTGVDIGSSFRTITNTITVTDPELFIRMGVTQ